MSKILFSVLCVILSLVSLFTFVRAAFGVSPLSAQQLVEKVSTLDFDFSATKTHLTGLKRMFEEIEFPNYEEGYLVDSEKYDQESLRMEMMGAILVEGSYSFDGSVLVCENGARFDADEYRIMVVNGVETVQVLKVYTLGSFLLHTVKGWLASVDEEDSFLYASSQVLLQISGVIGYLADVLNLFLQLCIVVFALAKDSVFFVVDAVLLLLYFLGIDTTSALPAV